MNCYYYLAHCYTRCMYRIVSYRIVHTIHFVLSFVSLLSNTLSWTTELSRYHCGRKCRTRKKNSSTVVVVVVDERLFFRTRTRTRERVLLLSLLCLLLLLLLLRHRLFFFFLLVSSHFVVAAVVVVVVHLSLIRCQIAMLYDDVTPRVVVSAADIVMTRVIHLLLLLLDLCLPTIVVVLCC